MLHDKRGVPVMVHDVLKMFHNEEIAEKFFRKAHSVNNEELEKIKGAMKQEAVQ
jgi:hypothetical protein